MPFINSIYLDTAEFTSSPAWSKSIPNSSIKINISRIFAYCIDSFPSRGVTCSVIGLLVALTSGSTNGSQLFTPCSSTVVVSTSSVCFCLSFCFCFSPAFVLFPSGSSDSLSLSVRLRFLTALPFPPAVLSAVPFPPCDFPPFPPPPPSPSFSLRGLFFGGLFGGLSFELSSEFSVALSSSFSSLSATRPLFASVTFLRNDGSLFASLNLVAYR